MGIGISHRTYAWYMVGKISMKIPEYTLSLGFWILPLIAYSVFFAKTKLLGKNQKKAIAVNVGILAGVGTILDLFFARNYFLFPNQQMTLGLCLWGIPIEEFVFYIAGFGFILMTYVWCDEYFLKKYNVDDLEYYNYANEEWKLLEKRLPWQCIILPIVLVIAFTILKTQVNPTEHFLPSYMIFLTLTAFAPFYFFWRFTKAFINNRALILTLCITILISIIWEVTLALPRGYWDYDRTYMTGIFISPWHRLPLEAILVWVFSIFIILTYEFSKVLYFRDHK